MNLIGQFFLVGSPGFQVELHVPSGVLTLAPPPLRGEGDLTIHGFGIFVDF